MKSQFGVVLLAGWLMALGCQPSSSVQPEGSVVVATGKSARIDQNITVKVDSILDGRCPVNVQCIWAGNAKVVFTLSDVSASKSGNLCIGDCGKGFRMKDTTTIQLGQAPYQVILMSVTPAPHTDSLGVQKQAAIQVKKL